MLTLIFVILAQTPPPRPTVRPSPTPVQRERPTPAPGEATPEPARTKPPGSRLLVSAQWAPADYVSDKSRGTEDYDPLVSNYSYHFVRLPAARPLTITDCNFTQTLAGTVVFFAPDGSALRELTDVSFVGCNLRNAWLPPGAATRECQTLQADITPEPTPTATPR